MDNPNNEQQHHHDKALEKTLVTGMYKDWFLDYASYVIMERAVPKLEDGLKPVQRRILHSMKEMDDGRFNKVANIIGQTMQYHPHGDAAIGEAMVNMGQKDLMIETQGNWGDLRTGDSAAAPRYIEARLSKFALEVAFNNQTTEWQLSYDGRKKEPVALPMKFPLVLAQGADGIAVGLATKILPHNFIELLQASIDVLKGKRVNVLPDFPTGGLVDVSEYNEGQRGGKIRVRAKIEIADKKNLIIREIPFSTTTSSLIDSILKANDKGKIKIKKVMDNTAQDVEILIELQPGTSPDVAVDALFAFTDCEVSISPNACVIFEDKPQFLGVNDMLKRSTHMTVELLRRELEIKKGELEEDWHFSSLEKIFIEKRIYRDIEECETWEAVIEAIDKGLKPYKKKFKREITRDDIVQLTEIKIKRISKFDAKKADELIKGIETELEQVNHDLAHLTDFAINYFKKLIEKYGKGKERKTEIRIFDTIQASQVAASNAKLYVSRAEGFIGFGLKKDEFVEDCSDIDDVIAIRADGKMMVVKIDEKKFVGKDILYVSVWKKNDERKVYNAVYYDAGSKRTYVKRFNVTGVTRDKEYDITKGAKGSKVLYVTGNPNGEAEIINIQLSQGSAAKKKVFDFDFATLEIKGRGAQGNILTKYPVRKVTLKVAGVSTLGGMEVYLDETVGRLNDDKRGRLLGSFKGDDKILVIYKDGSYELTSYEFTNRYEMNDIVAIEKFLAQKPVSAVYYDGEKQHHFVKRFLIETTKTGTKYPFITEHKDSQLLVASTGVNVTVEVSLQKGKAVEKENINIDTFIDIKGWKSQGNRLSINKVRKVTLVGAEEYKVTEEEKLELPELDFGDGETYEQEVEDMEESPIAKAGLVKKTTDKSKKSTVGSPQSTEKKSTVKTKGTDVKIGTEFEWDMEEEKKKKDKGGKEQGKLF
jgi:topoisomerase IV subunit A